MSEIIEKLKAIEGQELKYKPLCEAIGIPIKTGESKMAQIKNLAVYCDLIKLEKPTRYLVKEVYSEEIKILGELDGHNKFQLMFEAALFQAFLDNGGKSLYLSKMDMLKLFKEVNDNFSFAMNQTQMNMLGEEYEYMPKMGEILYRVLTQWTERRIKSMATRKTVMYSEGFRLYKKKIVRQREYTITLDVPKESQTEKICQEIYNQAIEDILPEDWGKYNDNELLPDLEENKKQGKYWVPNYTWMAFEKRIKELVEQRFNYQYDNLKLVKVLSPPTIPKIRERLQELCNQLQATTHINEEVCRKALTISSLDYSTNKERKKFIELNIAMNPPVIFKEKLDKIYKKMEQTNK